MDLIRTRDGNYYEIFQVKEDEWMIKNQAGEKKKVLSFGSANVPMKGVPVMIEHKDKEISTQAIVDIFQRV
tara:strand:+ start:43 stop:255 length:213 start_codon:yes stop_codon:yes gene_type:complete